MFATSQGTELLENSQDFSIPRWASRCGAWSAPSPTRTTLCGRGSPCCGCWCSCANTSARCGSGLSTRGLKPWNWENLRHLWKTGASNFKWMETKDFNKKLGLNMNPETANFSVDSTGYNGMMKLGLQLGFQGKSTNEVREADCLIHQWTCFRMAVFPAVQVF